MGVLVVRNGTVQTLSCDSPQRYITPDRSESGWACFEQATGMWLLHAQPPLDVANATAQSPSVIYGPPDTTYVPTYSYSYSYPYSYYPYSYCGYPFFSGSGLGFAFNFGHGRFFRGGHGFVRRGPGFAHTGPAFGRGFAFRGGGFRSGGGFHGGGFRGGGGFGGHMGGGHR